MSDIETPTAPPSPDLGATPSTTPILLITPINSITEAANLLPATTLPVPKFLAPHGPRMERVVVLAKCAICCCGLSGATDKQTIVHVNRCWKRWKENIKVEKWLENIEKEEDRDESPRTARLILSDSGRKPPSGTLQTPTSLSASPGQALVLPSPPEDGAETACILCHLFFKHLSSLDILEHHHACIKAVEPKACPRCHRPFSEAWTDLKILAHFHRRHSGWHTKSEGRKAWAELWTALEGRRKVAVHLLKQTYGPRKEWGKTKHRHSFRGKMNVGRLDDAVVYTMPPTPLRRVEQIISPRPSDSDVQIEVTIVKRVRTRNTDSMILFLRHSFSVVELPLKLSQTRYLPEQVCKKTISAADIFPLSKDAKGKVTKKGKSARKVAALEDEKVEHRKSKRQRKSPSIRERMANADDSTADNSPAEDST
ncbi:hypothetical protein TUN199_10049 [Pyrenophora tritici-repentis]|uniref:Uncharacterized protein n=2 Tax=Pyrenophora tritici-repentis TaxID=45151 RepID=A0A2W1DL69_9PLEO|nr:uncharacterized protein PTRG_08840 [Pyrenophora tritici-repentis Pt-1C-BFP]KAF7442551.1 hypothetical protein A1F99_134200 [Pyrenophora tritici-repentis]EDU41891.1 predicted protein [Pyrenophora tritici-repentis Pt-1C-BFP]KAF7579072.1 hypothetical protein PtrM4_033120 [Pyrenophora tritici-repentis]KAI0573532.1 hypothetical protein Alg130_10054 [Pyrenophora tritici-repentis]KAI0574858.1 hypothetical protein Alg215_08347 [Pyrenophora tritici-repentis]